MKKTLIILFLIPAILLSACEMDVSEGDILGAYGNSEEEALQTESVPSDITLLYYPDMDTNPVTSTCLANNQLLKLVYRPLIRLDSSFCPQCVIAKSYTETEKELTVIIREDMKFSDGSSVTASDVVKSFNVARKNTSSPYYGSASLIAECTAKDSQTVVFTFRSLLQEKAGLVDFPVMKDGKEGVGCGPYKFAKQNGKEVLTANEYYPTEAQIPVLRLVETKTDDYVTTLFSAGELDVLSIPGNDDLSLTSLRNYTTITYPSNNLVYIGVNVNNEFLSDPAVRTAISSCIDRKKISSQSLVGLADPAVYPINPAYYKLPGQDTELTPDTKPLEGKTLDILVSEDSDIKMTIAAAISENLQSLGVKVTLRTEKSEEYQALVKSGNFDLYIGETAVPRTMDASYLYVTGGSMNYGGFSDSELDSLCKQFTENGTGLEEYLEAFLEKMPVIPVVFRKNVMYSTEDVTGYTGQSAWDSYGYFEKVSLVNIKNEQ